MAAQYKIKVEFGQTIWDIAIQEYGCIEGIVPVVLLNDLNFESPLAAGDELVILQTPEDVNELNPYFNFQFNKEIRAFFIDNNIKVNTGDA